MKSDDDEQNGRLIPPTCRYAAGSESRGTKTGGKLTAAERSVGTKSRRNRVFLKAKEDEPESDRAREGEKFRGHCSTDEVCMYKGKDE